MASRLQGRLAQVWQLPLLIVSVGLFGYAAYLFIDPKPALTIDEKISFAHQLLDNDRPEACIQYLNELLGVNRLQPEKQGQIHALLAESLDRGQKLNRTALDVNYRQIIEQERLAVSMGAKANAQTYRRLGEAYEAIDKPTEALDNYRRAMVMDQPRVFHLQRKVIELQMKRGDAGPAEASVADYLKLPDTSPAEQAWALENKAKLLADRGAFVEARAALAEALKLDNNDKAAEGQINFRLGYCAYKLGDNAEAERYLRLAMEQLTTSHPLDGDASLLLGQIFQERNDYKTAAAYFQNVIVSHPDSDSYLPAMLERGVCRVMQSEDAGGLSDLKFVTSQIVARESQKQYRDEAVVGLRLSSATLQLHDDVTGALEAMAYEQQLTPDPAPSFFARLGSVFEKRADLADRALANVSQTEKVRSEQQAREYRTKAGDAYIAYSRGLTISDDHGYGDALWHGINLYAKANNLPATISALELFVAERPSDALTPEALLRLGQSYQAAGQFNKAIDAYQRNEFRYPQSLAASKSAVPLAEAFIAKGPDFYSKAESVLLGVVEHNPAITPAAEEFRSALFQLSQLYYRTNRYDEAINRSQEYTDRYPDDARLGQTLFMMADSSRKAAALIDIKLLNSTPTSQPSPVVDIVEANAEKKQGLERARTMFDRVIACYEKNTPTNDVDKLDQKLANFYRGDCLYDLGQYADSIKQYDAAALKYHDDPSALAAYVQIVNAYVAMGKIDEAKTANERAKWLLRRMPPDAFENGAFAMPKSYWEQWLKWTSSAGLW